MRLLQTVASHSQVSGICVRLKSYCRIAENFKFSRAIFRFCWSAIFVTGPFSVITSVGQPDIRRGAYRADRRRMIDLSSLIRSDAVIYRFVKGIFATLQICHFLAAFDLGARAIDEHSVNRKICIAIGFTKRIL